jgi:Flp pilus assembly protein TadD
MPAVVSKSRRRVPHGGSPVRQPEGTAYMSGRRGFLVAAALVALLTLVTFAPVREFDFVNYDDLEFVVDNPRVAGGLTPENVAWAWQNPYEATGGPLTWMSHMLDVELFGLSAGGHHVTSLLLHTLSAIVLLAVLVSMTGSTWRSAAVAALFAVHPLHVESVAWVAERKDVLSGLFFFAAVGTYSWYAKRPSASRYAVIALLFVLGLLSKPMVATLPFVLLLLDVWPLGRLPWTTWSWRSTKPLVLEKLPLLALAVAAMLLTLQAQTEIGALDGGQVPFQTRLSNAVVSYGAYLLKTMWPSGLIPYYPYRTSLSTLKVVASAAVLAGLTAGALVARSRAPYATVGWFWFVGMLVPVIGLVQVGGHAMADRFTYLPSVGIFVGAIWGAAALGERLAFRRAVVPIVALVVVMACAVTARVQSQHWRNGVALWEHTVRVDPANARAFSNLGVSLALNDRHEGAIRAYEESLRLHPGVPQTHHNLGLALEAVGRSDDAMAQYEEAVRLRPAYAKARMHLANQLARRGRIEEAVAHYREALRLEPEEALTHANLAVTLATAGRPGDAVPHMLEAARLAPQNTQFRFVAARMLLETGRTAEAERLLEQVLAVDPGHRAARETLQSLRR